MAVTGSHFEAFLRVLLLVVSVGFFLSGIDDLLVDLCHIFRSIYRRLFVLSRHPKFTVDQIMGVEEKPVAIMIPAWQEASVIGKMLRHTLGTLNYSNYHVFVGTYPNDEDTGFEVERVRERHDRVHRIVCPQDGPTNKADCLNWIGQGIRLHERESGQEFAFFAIQDAEDIVHPLSLRLFNYLIPRRDMVQLPVYPLESKWNKWISGHYLDEFAEFHSKNLSIREVFSKTVPSAGVGFAFSRKVLEVLSHDRHNQVFNTNTLAEDYEFGLSLLRYGLKGIFVHKALTLEINRRHRRGIRKTTVAEYIATRERFPDRFWAAVKQKARWSLGITMQGWAELGWEGEFGNRYALMQDRKALISSQISMFGYVVVTAAMVLWLRAWLMPESYQFPVLVKPGSWVWYLILIDTGFLVWRLLMRSYYVWNLYGIGQAVLSFPRQIVGNLVNWVAVCRAIYLGLRYLLTGRRTAWDKTDHVFPSPDELKVFHRRLGDLLLERRFVTVEELNEALRRQRATAQSIGTILLDMGVIDEDLLIQVLSQQLRVATRDIDPSEIPLDALKVLPRYLAVQCRVIPLEIQGDTLIVASDEIVSRARLESLEKVTMRHVEVVLAPRSDIAFALSRAYRRLAEPVDPPGNRQRLGDLLLRRKWINLSQLDKAFRRVKRSYMPLGDVLLKQGAITPRQLLEVLGQYVADTDGLLGEYLIRAKYITQAQLQLAISQQNRHFRPLGQVLIEMNSITHDQLRQVLKEQAASS